MVTTQCINANRITGQQFDCLLQLNTLRTTAEVSFGNRQLKSCQSLSSAQQNDVPKSKPYCGKHKNWGHRVFLLVWDSASPYNFIRIKKDMSCKLLDKHRNIFEQSNRSKNKLTWIVEYFIQVVTFIDIHQCKNFWCYISFFCASIRFTSPLSVGETYDWFKSSLLYR